jgi:hypothetical protein
LFQITKDLFAAVTLTSGDQFEYRVTDDEIADARRKMPGGLGLLEWQPNFGSKTDPRELLNIAHIARIRAFPMNNYDNVLIQLWRNPETGRLYLADPDDGTTAWCIQRDARNDNEPFDFARDAWNLLETNVSLKDLGIPVGRPPADEVVWQLAAEYHGEHRGVTLHIGAEGLNEDTIIYLAPALLRASVDE